VLAAGTGAQTSYSAVLIGLPVVALELLSRGDWSGVGVKGPEAFDALPFLELLAEYGEPHGTVEVPDRAPG